MPDALSPNHPLKDVLAALRRESQRPDIRLGDLLAAFGPASFVPALLVPALIVFSPTSGIPLLSSVCGLTAAMIAAQMLTRRSHLWLPGVLANRRISGRRLGIALRWLDRPAQWLDRLARPRLGLFYMPPLTLLTPLACLICGLAMPFLELVPFSSSILGGAIILFAVGLLVRDGAFFLLGVAAMAAGGAIPFFVVQAIAE